MLPKTEKALDKAYKRCLRDFVTIEAGTYTSYFEEALSDLDSAEKEQSNKWAMAKAYQALFLYCNGLLVKKAGFYSKDHGCVLIGLLKHSIVAKETLQKIHELLEKKKEILTEVESNFFEEVNNLRIKRNNYLYLPKNLGPARERVNEVRELMQILGEAE